MRIREISPYEVNIMEKGTKEDILDRLYRLAKAYAPEWRPDKQRPDAGAVIAMLYAAQMEENVKRYDQSAFRFYTEFVNLTGISQKSARPASSVVLMELVRNTVPGVFLAEGTKLVGEGETGDNPVFETENPVYLTSAVLSAAFQTSESGAVKRLWGDFPNPSRLEDGNGEENRRRTAEAVRQKQSAFPFSLFAENEAARFGETLLLYHPCLFDGKGEELFIRFSNGGEILDGLEAGDISLSWYSAPDFTRIKDFRRAGEELLAVQKEGVCGKVNRNGREYSVLALETQKPVPHTLSTGGIGLSAAGRAQPPELIYDGRTSLEAESFYPFGETLTEFAGVSIGHREYFNRPGARVDIRFTVEHQEKLVSYPVRGEQEELKIIKRRPKTIPAEAPADVYAQRIIAEYFNGTGWMPLKTKQPAGGLLDGNGAGERLLSFICPSDWAETQAGGLVSRFLKITLVKADDCYLIPALHHYPVIKNMELTFSMEDRFEKPHLLEAVRSASREELTETLRTESPIPVFKGSPYTGRALYLALDRKPESGPVSLLFQVQDTAGRAGIEYDISCFAQDGFRGISPLDHTDGFRNTGTMLFYPPPDMKRYTLEGVSAYWIRISQRPGKKARDCVIRGIDLNAVSVRNVDTREEEEFYIDEAGPDMSFVLNAPNILWAQVWVNENLTLSPGEKKKLLDHQPDRVSAEYGMNGEIVRFFVEWEEVESFARSGREDRHYRLDRAARTIHFGDGAHAMYPGDTQDTAFKVRVRSCDGERANVSRGRISESLKSLMYVEKIFNVQPAYGGKDMETAQRALYRGTALFAGGNRMLTRSDYERESLCYSSGIVQAKAVCRQKRNGDRDVSSISIVLLMEDYAKGPDSFLAVRKGLLAHFLSGCELSADAGSLFIEEPVFLDYSVTVWARAEDGADGLALQRRLIKALEDFLDPVKNEKIGIGQLPTQSQISLRLQMEKGRSVITNIMVTVGFRNEAGYHEAEPAYFKENPFAAPRSGSHKIYLDQK